MVACDMCDTGVVGTNTTLHTMHHCLRWSPGLCVLLFGSPTSFQAVCLRLFPVSCSGINPCVGVPCESASSGWIDVIIFVLVNHRMFVVHSSIFTQTIAVKRSFRPGNCRRLEADRATDTYV
jgi:hypothetical protein